MIGKLKKATIFLGVFVLGVALGVFGEKLLTKKEEENVFRQRQSEYQFINPCLTLLPLKKPGGGFVFKKKLEELINTAVKSNKASQVGHLFSRTKFRRLDWSWRERKICSRQPP